MKCVIIRALERLRYFSFWSMDYLRGSKIKKSLNNIDYHIEHYHTKKAQVQRSINLNNLLNHATQTTDFYKEFGGFKSLTDFPIIDKNSLQKYPDDFKSNVFKNKKTKIVSTSGSTGAALFVEHDKGKIIRNTADTIYFSQKAGFKIGYRLLYLRHWNPYYKKGKLQTWFQNILPVEVLNMQDAKLLKLIKYLKTDCSTKGFIGYASGFEQLCQFLDEKKMLPLQVNVKSIIAMSEHLNYYTKAKMGYYFSAPVVSRYSNMENGILAQQNIGESTNFEINWASYFIEVLDFKNDNHVVAGQPGRIVITDLFNYCTPIIRYDTGDIGLLDATSSPPAFKSIEGRKTDVIYNTRGEMVSSFIMINANKFHGIKQCQLVQTAIKTYLLKLNTKDTFHEENQVLTEFKKYLGSDANLSIQYVDEIPLLASGKRKATLNKMKSS
ncbi:CoF synthetase [Changchengzhania lutea]|uniref:CoF synthetase n=1 Tax=Changchengzhania lutea TaxID=2049305 RepID=UPI00115C4E65|nr:CoF synthetase [Changchengzhania lutea]